ncbi:hypothetical protein KKB44_01265 [Candidatus Micrarchaeota archaeon]|nr:hypothetical protein [Candidatus Micrarchaeota archaeon]
MINSSLSNNFTNNMVHDILWQGFNFWNASDSVLTNNNVYGNDVGIGLDTCGDNYLINNELYDNSIGLGIVNSSATFVTRDHYYNNTIDFGVNGTGITINLSEVIFDNPLGNFVNFTNISLNDTVASAYSIDHAVEPAPLPTGATSFENKFVNITNATSGVSIDSIVWHWTDAESVAYDEPAFGVWEYDGSWSDTGATLDTAANTLSLSNLATFSIFAILESPEDEENPSDEDKEFSLSFDSTCDGNTLTVTYNGNPVPGASVNVYNPTTMQTIALGTTNVNGEFEFSGCDLTIQVHVSKTGYDSETVTEQLINCELCLEEEEHLECVDDLCIVVPGLGPNLCSLDADCMEPVYECYSDNDCDDTDYCDILEGEAGGNCLPVTGDCGYAQNHTWVQYECGVDPECVLCPEGLVCVEHQCVEANLTGPGEGFVDAEVDIIATINNETCAYCDIEIVDPTGEHFTGLTDENGRIQVPLNLKGQYTITLLQNGQVLASKTVDAIPKAPPTDEPPPTEKIGEDFTWLWLFILLAGFFILFFYWRQRKKKK